MAIKKPLEMRVVKWIQFQRRRGIGGMKNELFSTPRPAVNRKRSTIEHPCSICLEVYTVSIAVGTRLPSKASIVVTASSKLLIPCALRLNASWIYLGPSRLEQYRRDVMLPAECHHFRSMLRGAIRHYFETRRLRDDSLADHAHGLIDDRPHCRHVQCRFTPGKLQEIARFEM